VEKTERVNLNLFVMLLYVFNNILSAEQAICMFIFSSECRIKSKRLHDIIKMSQISITGRDSNNSNLH
jgi:hypothetical protein